MNSTQHPSDYNSSASQDARSPAEMQRRADWFALLGRMSAALSTTMSLDEVLDHVTTETAEALGVRQATTILLDQAAECGQVVCQYRKARKAVPSAEPVPIKDTPWLERVMATRLPLAIANVQHNPLAQSVRDTLQNQDIQSILIVPMLVRHRVVGAVALSAADEERVFGPAEIELAQTIANYAGLAVENAGLVQNVQAADQAKSEFIDFVAHELKQPMTAMQGYAKMLTMGIGGQMNETQTQFVDVITANVDRMGQLINALLEISRLEAGRIKLTLLPLPLRSIVTEVATNMGAEIEARHHALEIEVPDELPPVLADGERLIQILTNLLSNACRYTPEGGTLRIAVAVREGIDPPAGHLLVSVTDSGIGMSPQEMANLGKKFYRADHDLVNTQPGIGLGVPIARKLVELHGGEFLVDSKEAVGSTFSFTVPVAGGVAR